MATRPVFPRAAPPIEARLLTGVLMVGCLPHALVTRRPLGAALDTARDAVAHIYSLPG